MGKVTYAPGIQYVKGALAKPVKKEGHKHGDYLIATHREAPTTNQECTRIYLRKASTYDRKTAIGANERDNRDRFAAIAAAIAVRKKDMTKLTQDQASFKAQKDQPGGIKTMQAWYWAQEGATYDANH